LSTGPPHPVPGTEGPSPELVAAEPPLPEAWFDPCLAGIHAAGLPYFDLLFGSPEASRAALRNWVLRPSSEVYLGRVRLAVQDGQPLGGFVALTGEELARARRADLMALLAGTPAAMREELLERLRTLGDLFPSVDAGDFYLSKIWVDPERRGHGLGLWLCRRYLATGRELGRERFALDVHEGNEAAIRLYRTLGFAVVGGGKGATRHLRMARAAEEEGE
jgi:ribosomal protein S18 acetylase RimI-like enzyme